MRFSGKLLRLLQLFHFDQPACTLQITSLHVCFKVHFVDHVAARLLSGTALSLFSFSCIVSVARTVFEQNSADDAPLLVWFGEISWVTEQILNLAILHPVGSSGVPSWVRAVASGLSASLGLPGTSSCHFCFEDIDRIYFAPSQASLSG